VSTRLLVQGKGLDFIAEKTLLSIFADRFPCTREFLFWIAELRSRLPHHEASITEGWFRHTHGFEVMDCASRPAVANQETESDLAGA